MNQQIRSICEAGSRANGASVNGVTSGSAYTPAGFGCGTGEGPRRDAGSIKPQNTMRLADVDTFIIRVPPHAWPGPRASPKTNTPRLASPHALRPAPLSNPEPPPLFLPARWQSPIPLAPPEYREHKGV